MISMDMSLRHTAWADDRLFRDLQALPDSALACTYASPEWSVARIAKHIVEGAEWYRFVLTGTQWRELENPRNAHDLEVLREYLAQLNAALLTECAKDDEILEFSNEDGPGRVLRSVILAQTAYHSTEHRTQIAVALESNGVRAIDLDTYDVWNFQSNQS